MPARGSCHPHRLEPDAQLRQHRKAENMRPNGIMPVDKPDGLW